MSKNGWKETAFNDMADLIKDGYHPTGSDNFKYIGLEHIDQQSLSLNSVGHSTEVGSNKFRFKGGDILFGKLRPYFRKVYRPRFDGVCSTDIWVVRAKNGIDQGYLFYRMASHEFVDMASSGSSGTRMPRADWNHLKDTRWPVPSLPTQKKIAKILGDLDEKIELNHQMNKTLESIAQAVFKKWFVGFEFPGHEKTKFVNGLPEGWREGTLKEIVVNYDSKRVPLSSRERDDRKGPYPYYGAATIVDYIDDYLFDGIYVLMGEDGTVVAEQGLPVLQYVWGKFWVNIHTHVLQGMNGISTEFIWLLLSQTNVQHIVTGAVQPKISQSNMNDLPVVIPDSDTINKFQMIIEPLFRKYRLNCDELFKLQSIRDSLLPKLMSGEICVNSGRKS